MRATKVMQGVRTMRFFDVYERKQAKKLTVEAAAEILGVNERTFRRWCQRYEEEGAQGLYDKRLDRAAHNAAPTDEVMACLNLFTTRYHNFSVAHFYEKRLA